MASQQIYSIFFLILNIFLLTNAQYIGLPGAEKNLSATINQTISLVCQYIGTDGDGEFTGWWKDNDMIDKNKSEHYEIVIELNQTKLIIKFNETDELVENWIVRTNKQDWKQPPQCQFKKITLKSSPRYIRTNKDGEKIENEGTIRRIAKEELVLNCINKPKQPKTVTKSRPTLWKYSIDGSNFTELPSDVEITNLTQIKIHSLKKIHRGYYQCSFNDVSLKVFVRVKDPYAALWPFIGIVSTVLALIVIILVFEKRQANAKKRAAALVNDEANDNANKPLVTTSNKLSDDDNNKKSTVNA